MAIAQSCGFTRNFDAAVEFIFGLSTLNRPSVNETDRPEWLYRQSGFDSVDRRRHRFPQPLLPWALWIANVPELCRLTKISVRRLVDSSQRLWSDSHQTPKPRDLRNRPHTPSFFSGRFGPLALWDNCLLWALWALSPSGMNAFSVNSGLSGHRYSGVVDCNALLAVKSSGPSSSTIQNW